MKYFSCFYYTILFRCSKNIRQYSTHYFVMKLSNKRELQQIGFNHSSDTDFQDFLNLYNIDIDTIDSTLTSDNPLRFRRNLVERI